MSPWGAYGRPGPPPSLVHSIHPVWRCGATLFTLDRTLIMGVLNVTPDSFSDGGRTIAEDAIAHGRALAGAGADIIDIGGESTRPGASLVPEDEERRRVLPVIEALAAAGLVISLDTSKAAVARAGIAAGARILNDVAGFRDPEMVRVAAESDVGLCVMHMQGEPRTMQVSPTYDDVVLDVARELSAAVLRLDAAGVSRDRITVDPGIGFGKTLAHNLALIRAGHLLTAQTGCPVLMGVSRKSFLGTLTGKPPTEREFGTAAAVTAAILTGSSIVRVHDVAAQRDVVRVADALRGQGYGV
ncbi:MAG: dihydropteroate synthase [Myxococcales bacterium]|nr:dihydropteroate synthase [Myxococcales bacterium]